MKYSDITAKNIDISKENLENFFNIYENIDGLYFFNMLKTVYIPEDLDPDVYIIYTIKPQDTWYLISYINYSTIKLWWLVCCTNNIINPLTLPVEGVNIKIIKPEYVSNIISKLTN